MDKYLRSMKGDRSMTRGFIAQYAKQAAMRISGVVELKSGPVNTLRELLGVESIGGVQVSFHVDETVVRISVYPVIQFGLIVPEVAWEIQESVKTDVEAYTGLTVDKVDVSVVDIVDVNIEPKKREFKSESKEEHKTCKSE